MNEISAQGVTTSEPLDAEVKRDRENLFRYLRARRKRLRLPEATDEELLSSVRNWRSK